MSATEEPISFDRQIKPLFRDRDRQPMKWAFDLSYVSPGQRQRLPQAAGPRRPAG